VLCLRGEDQLFTSNPQTNKCDISPACPEPGCYQTEGGKRNGVLPGEKSPRRGGGGKKHRCDVKLLPLGQRGKEDGEKDLQSDSTGLRNAAASCQRKGGGTTT